MAATKIATEINMKVVTESLRRKKTQHTLEGVIGLYRYL